MSKKFWLVCASALLSDFISASIIPKLYEKHAIDACIAEYTVRGQILRAFDGWVLSSTECGEFYKCMYTVKNIDICSFVICERIFDVVFVHYS